MKTRCPKTWVCKNLLKDYPFASGAEKRMNPTERMIGKEIEFQDECTGLIVDETEDAIYILSDFFTGWMFKAEYFELLGEAV